MHPARRSRHLLITFLGWCQASVSELKQELAGITSIPVDRQRLIYHGRVMRDDQTLAELGRQLRTFQNVHGNTGCRAI